MAESDLLNIIGYVNNHVCVCAGFVTFIHYFTFW